MMDIKKTNKTQAYRMLQCLAVAIRPLSVAELAELLAFEFNAAKEGIPKLNVDWRWDDHEQAVLSTCSSLITIDYAHGDPVVQFSHFSVKEFLLSDRLATSSKEISWYHVVLEDANTLIARACLCVLLRDPVNENRVETAPLTQYAAEHWVAHALVENVASRIRDGMEQLFDPDRPYFSAWVRSVDRDYWGSYWPSQKQAGAAPLYYAALCGLHEMARHLVLKYPQYANAIGGETGTALHAASYAGHINVVRSLLKSGVDVDARGRWNQSPLQFVSAGESLGVVQCLLDYGANVNFQDDFGNTPLRRALRHGSIEIVRVLLEHNADVNSQDKAGVSPMDIANLKGGPKGEIVRYYSGAWRESERPG